MEMFRFCPYCGVEMASYDDEGRPRARCPSCRWVHYRNPTVGVAVILIEEERILLGKRRDGGWCVPCGHVEWDESIQLAAEREFEEETGLVVNLGPVVAVRSNFHNLSKQTVGVWFSGERRSGEVRPGGDLLAVEFFPLGRLPELKFPTDQNVLEELLGRRPDR